MPDVKLGRYETLLEEMRKRYDYACDQWQDIREEARTDMRYDLKPW